MHHVRVSVALLPLECFSLTVGSLVWRRGKTTLLHGAEQHRTLSLFRVLSVLFPRVCVGAFVCVLPFDWWGRQRATL